MDETERELPLAWQPLTPGGVAAFASATLARLWIVQFIFAALAAAAVLWVLLANWTPVLDKAIASLPERGEIQNGLLQWPEDSPRRLAGNSFLAIVVDLDHRGELRLPAHVLLEFGRADCTVFSLFGSTSLPYTTRRNLPVNRISLIPWWGAWAPPIFALLAGATILGLLLVWAVLATLYAVPAWLVSLFADRQLTLRGCWRLAGAALMPGALFLTLSLVLYGAAVFDPLRLLVAVVTHFPVGWIYLVWSVLRVPSAADAAGLGKHNPFLPSRGAS